MNLAMKAWSVFKVKRTTHFVPVFAMMANVPMDGCVSRSILLRVKLTFVYHQRSLEMEHLVTLARMVKSARVVCVYQMVRALSVLNHARKMQIAQATLPVQGSPMAGVRVCPVLALEEEVVLVMTVVSQQTAPQRCASMTARRCIVPKSVRMTVTAHKVRGVLMRARLTSVLGLKVRVMKSLWERQRTMVSLVTHPQIVLSSCVSLMG
jgi:hypothetical protein